MKKLKKTFRRGERGNVLFLILIAVALFAALSYAVTSSTRGGGGNASEETSLVQSSAVTQYPSAVRTALIRMIVNGVDSADLLFDSPENSFGDEINTTQLERRAVFHPRGGGASKGTAPADIMESGNQGIWLFSSDYQIVGIGTDDTTATSPNPANDIIAFLPGVTNALCTKVNEELGITITTGVASGVATAPTAAANEMALDSDGAGNDNSGFGDYAATRVIGDDFASQPFGCFETADGTNVYYHVLVER